MLRETAVQSISFVLGVECFLQVMQQFYEEMVDRKKRFLVFENSILEDPGHRIKSMAFFSDVDDLLTPGPILGEHLLEFVETCQNLQRFVENCRKLLKFARIR